MSSIFKKFSIIAMLFCLQLNVSAGIFKKINDANPFKYSKASPIKNLKFFEVKSDSDDKSKRKLYKIVKNLSIKLKIKTPKVFIYRAKKQTYEYNAFASYADHKLKHTCVCMGALFCQRWQEGWITDQEIEAIMAHELCHVKFNHALKLGLFYDILNGPSLISKIIVPTPSPKELIKNAYSRKKEREADEKAIRVIDDPFDLFTALVKLHCLNTKSCEDKETFIFKYIRTARELVRERKNSLAPLVELLQTHPLTSKRIAYIKKYAQKHGHAPFELAIQLKSNKRPSNTKKSKSL